MTYFGGQHFWPNQAWTGRVELVGGIVGGNGFREKGGRGIRVRRVQVWLLTYNLLSGVEVEGGLKGLLENYAPVFSSKK